MGRATDLSQVDAVAEQYGIRGLKRKEFGKYLEIYKRKYGRGKLVNGDFDWDELCERAEEFQEDSK